MKVVTRLMSVIWVVPTAITNVSRISSKLLAQCISLDGKQ